MPLISYVLLAIGLGCIVIGANRRIALWGPGLILILLTAAAIALQK